MSGSRCLLFSIMSVLTLSLSIPSSAAQGEKPNRKELIQMHKDMAKRHNETAKCIKDGRPIAECNQKAMKGCPMMKSGKCPFMNDGMGMMKHDIMPIHNQKKKDDTSQ